MFSNKAECEMSFAVVVVGGGVWARTGEREISIRKGTAESRPEELKRQYPDSGSLTKLCALNAQTPPPTTGNRRLVQRK